MLGHYSNAQADQVPTLATHAGVSAGTRTGLVLHDTTSDRSRQLPSGEANASVTAVAWSPDRSTLAYTLFHRRPDDRVSSAELFTA